MSDVTASQNISDIDTQVESYTRAHPSYLAYATKLTVLLTDLIKSENIQIHVAEGRAKDIAGFREKLQRPGKSYRDGIEEITDLVGARLITYYLDDVEKIISIIKNNFDIVEEELSHQPSSFAVDRFGYISAHYIVRLLPNRKDLPEWKSFANYKAEIQIRTVIQHAWSAVSHAIQYKSVTQIPSPLQRRLYRIAGLFELADEEFKAIRVETNKQITDAEKALSKGHNNIALSAASIDAFLNKWAKRQILEKSAINAGFEIKEQNDNYTGNIYDLCKRVGIDTIAELERVLNEQDFSRLATIYGGQRNRRAWTASMNFIIYIMLISSYSKFVTADYLVDTGGWSKGIAEDVISSLNQ